MHSKWRPWDFARNHSGVVGDYGVYAFFAYDPYIERLFLKKIPTERLAAGKFNVVMGAEITVEWLQNNFQTVSLFGNNESFLVLQSDELSTKVKTYLLENKLSLENRYLIFSASKDAKFLEQLAKKAEYHLLYVESPRHWEGDKLLSFLCHELKMVLPLEVQQYVLKSIPMEAGDYINTLKLTRLHFRDQIDLRELQELIMPCKYDKFELASLFGSKKKAACILRLLRFGDDFKILEDFFNFISGHLFKLLDTTSLKKKSYLSKYDKELITFSKLWSEAEIKQEMRKLGEFQLCAKKRDVLLREKLRLYYLEGFELL